MFQSTSALGFWEASCRAYIATVPATSTSHALGISFSLIMLRLPTWFPSWAPDGRRISYFVAGAGSYSVELSAEGAPGKPVPVGHADPSLLAWEWSPDGRFLSVLRSLEDRLYGGIGVLDVSTGAFRQLADSGGTPVWLRDSRRLLFWDAGGLKLVDAATGQIREAGRIPNPDERMSLSPDDRRLYFTASSFGSDIWMAQAR